MRARKSTVPVPAAIRVAICSLALTAAGWSAMGLVFRPHFLFLLADSYARTGRIEEARETIAEALSVTAHTHEGFAEPELHRLKGELPRESAEAEACFRQAIEIAHRQHARSFELRAMLS